MRLRSGRLSRRSALSSPKKRFPFKDQHRKGLPDCHLVRTAILCPSFYDSLEVFPYSLSFPYPLLQVWFQYALFSLPSGRRAKEFCIIYPPYPLKAGYAAHSIHTAALVRLRITNRKTGFPLCRNDLLP